MDAPLTPAAWGRLHALETKAAMMYREKYADAPDWRELSDTTRQMWVDFAEKQMSNAEVTGSRAATPQK